jgi:hypothetical protein
MMKPTVRPLLFLVFVLTYSSLSLCQQVEAPHSRAESNALESEEDTVHELEVALLKARLEETASFQQSLLSTVYWTLGVLATMMLALIGYSWFVNFRVYERDKLALERDLLSTIQTSIRELETSLTTDIQSRLDQAILGLDEKATSIESNLKGLVDTALTNLVVVELKLAELQGDYCAERKWYGNAFSQYIHAARLHQRLENDHGFAFALERIEKLLGKMKTVSGTDITKISEFVNSLPDQNLAHVQRIKDLLNKASVL